MQISRWNWRRFSHFIKCDLKSKQVRSNSALNRRWKKARFLQSKSSTLEEISKEKSTVTETVTQISMLNDDFYWNSNSYVHLNTMHMMIETRLYPQRNTPEIFIKFSPRTKIEEIHQQDRVFNSLNCFE